ncbi:amino acid transporter [Cystoisospora suis]|uniref:Amino acid transporter n=1 Tax=Cystoisospora suis TaxID=483139 RepID=A0A2C6KHT1_9APIC|nr:amino acid transporter [Cystoisospora suis]
MVAGTQHTSREGGGSEEDRDFHPASFFSPSFTIIETKPPLDVGEFTRIPAASPVEKRPSGFSTQQANPKAPFFSRWMLTIRKVLPRTDLPGARQPTPLNLNRYVLLLVYLLYIACTGVCFYGWPALASIIFRNEGFASQCRRNPDTGDYEEDLRVTQGKPYICDEQDGSVQKLYTMTCAICSTMCAFAGALVDFAGPRLTAVLGQIANLTGWLLLSFSGMTDVFYYLGLTMIGLGADTAFLPTFSITRLFPGSSGLIITLLGSAVSASYAVPLVLHEIMERYNLSSQTVCLGYACLCPLSCVGVAVVFMPRRGFLLADGLSAEETMKGVVESSGRREELGDFDDAREPSEEAEKKQLAVERSMLKNENEDNANCNEETAGFGQLTTSIADDSLVDETAVGNTSTTPISRRSPQALEDDSNDFELTPKDDVEAVVAGPAASTAQSLPEGEEGAVKVVDFAGLAAESEKQSLELKLHSEKSEETRRRARCVRCLGPRLEPFLQQLTSERYILIVLYKIGVVVAAAYFQQATRRTFSEDVVRVRGIILPFAFIPCIFLGKLADTIHITRVLFIINTSGICMYGFSFSGSYACGCISVVFFTIYMSMYSSPIFVYVESTFSPQDFGKLGGLTLMIGGLLGLLTNPLYERVTVRLSKGSPLSMQIVMTILLGVQFLWITRLYSLYKKDPHPFRDKSSAATSQNPHGDMPIVASPGKADSLLRDSRDEEGSLHVLSLEEEPTGEWQQISRSVEIGRTLPGGEHKETVSK